ncbi:MAG: helicase-related protein [Rhodovibrionaceae bacterium]
MTPSPSRRVTAVLGPTNTGKTYLAMERMAAHDSGIMGFPLRLLARENYDRMVAMKGAGAVALITGEEKIVPPGARYFLCTVESMPLGRDVEFLAVDEIQLAADPERGHVFTERLLKARGREETMFLGAETARSLLRRLVPGAETVSRPRFSTLSYIGPRKLTRLPPRSAVVAFSAAEVYAMAELMRRQAGGTAVVLGALSPRTRNAQVAMFEAGEVDYLVATDAIGMGLNLDLDHVAFARLSKFDGRRPRQLSAAEVGQIAGRAGRHMADGSFGPTGDLGPFSPEMIEAVETHSFEPLHAFYWRNGELDFRSPEQLKQSLEERPPLAELIRVRDAEDQRSLDALLRDPEMTARASGRDRVRLLWEVAQVPDFGKTLTDQHVRLLATLYRHLADGDGRLPEDWVAGQVRRLDKVEGDIDSLVARLAHIRTWTFITHRADWLADSDTWQEMTRGIEDRLSDALHGRLTQRFVDTRAATLIKRLKGGEDLMGAVRANGEVVVEGQTVGHLEGFRFTLDTTVAKDDAPPVLTAARHALGEEIPRRLAQLEADNDGAFLLTEAGKLTWRGNPVARLAKGDSALRPRIEADDCEFFDGPMRERVRQRLVGWLQRHLRNRLSALYALQEAEFTPAARGLAFQLAESLGCLPRYAVSAQLRELDKDDRKKLTEMKLRLGAASIFVPALLKPSAIQLRALLWAVFNEREAPTLPREGAASFVPILGDDFCNAIGYRRLSAKQGVLAVRADVLERLAFEARRLSATEGFAVPPVWQQLLEGGEAEVATALIGLGYRAARQEEGLRFYRKGPRRRPADRPAESGPATAEGEAAGPRETSGGEAQAAPQRPRQERGRKRKDAQGKKNAGGKGQQNQPRHQPREKQPDPHSPFAVLKELKFGG